MTPPTQKDSGLEWLGDIPKNWAVKRGKALFSEARGRSQNGEEELLTVSHITGVTPRSEKNVSMFEAESTEGYKLCRVNDLAINTMWAWMGALGISPLDGIVSPSYNVYEPRDTKGLAYYDYLFRTPAFVAELNRWSKGIWKSRLRLYPAEFFQIELPVPPPDARCAIASFLDVRTSALDSILEKANKLPSLVAERRRALVEEATSAEGTDSLRLEAVVDRVARPIKRDPEHEYRPVGLLNRGRGVFHKELTLGKYLGDSSFFWLEEGDLILSGQFAWEGAVALAGAMDTGCVATHRYPVLRGKSEVLDTRYLLAFLTTSEGDFLLNEHSRGAAGRNRPLNVRTLLKEKIPVPPFAVQQKVGAEVLFERDLGTSIARLVGRVKEYREALITAAVTGKIDVTHKAVP